MFQGVMVVPNHRQLKFVTDEIGSTLKFIILKTACHIKLLFSGKNPQILYVSICDEILEIHTEDLY